ncbi:ATP-dependent (S)-NAD(P)H-hydrate dehydratase [Colias croceus]|uniref:ATP-dependent (S)-NAD(P)H-hydrate dehydratase n=1 Tax=Colias crocea TaxID=72248 RepID=UPI001E27A8D8|nr:ATP-dependent (S)-NAD(P)H-hydrate dehydratase [Colias croceus]
MFTLRILSRIFLNTLNMSKVSTAQMNTAEILKLAQSCIPALDNKKHKGQAGRIGIIGGSLEYTGAPYFAGISALKVGADLVHIFCASQAATVIKSYSPELIVHPLLDDKNAVEKISPWFERLHAIVIGPGLGRDSNIFSVTSELIRVIREKQIPLVIDADGLFLITENCNLIQDFNSPIILTPNKIEFERLCNKIDISSKLINKGSNITILKKGEIDELLSPNDNVRWSSNIGGSGRRCGGQGDILSGSIATFLHWTLLGTDNIYNGENDKQLVASSIACYGASLLVRKCNEEAFKIKGRSMLATDMIEYIHTVFNDLYEK